MTSVSDHVAPAESLIAAYLEETRDQGNAGFPLPWQIKPAAFPSGRAMLEATPELQVVLAPLVLRRTLGLDTFRSRLGFLGTPLVREMDGMWRLQPVLTALYRRALPYRAADLQAMVELLLRATDSLVGWTEFGQALPMTLRQVARAVETDGLPADLRASLTHLRAALTAPNARHDTGQAAERRKAVAILDGLLGLAHEADLIDADDDWGHAARELLDQMAATERGPWLAVLRHAAAAQTAKPARSWLAEARRRVDAIGEAPFQQQAIAWLELLDQPSRNTRYQPLGGEFVPTTVVAGRNGELLRGLAWYCSLLDDARVARALGAAAFRAYTKVPEIGPRSVKAANACVWALGVMPSPEAATELQRLSITVRYGPAARLIDEAILRAAERAGLTPDDLGDLAVPHLGLEDGRIRHPIGDVTAQIVIVNAHEVATTWFAAGGAARPAPPAALKRTHAAELRALARRTEEVRQQLSVQRQRTERLLSSRRSWPLDRFRDRWLEHPLLSVFARRLIWLVEDAAGARPGAWLGGRLVDCDDRPLDPAADARVRPWHPLAAEPAAVPAWRGWFERHGVTQPFKQAHREIYLLTEAERATTNFSNRFADHLLRQHQLRALCLERGWTYRLQGSWDGHNNPTITLPEWDLCAELDIAPLDDGGPAGALSGRAVNLFVATGAVRFHRGAGAPKRTKDALVRAYLRGEQLPSVDTTLPLAEVPAAAFSEVMRDVDLFVSVCSLGNLPEWVNDDQRQLAGYWQRSAFGPLTECGDTRREVIARLTPRLTIASRCTVTERFLEVRGELHSYRIHLASGNIIMDDGRYLCIRPAAAPQRPAAGLALPFEGDGMLSEILSKALLLASDRAIDDPSITSQL